jgi:hypothetical protein
MKNNKLLIFGVYSKLMISARQYNHLQAIFRNLSITWVVASLVAIGFLFSFEKTEFPFDPLIGSIFISIIGILALLFFWYEDSVIKEDYLNNLVYTALKLERKYSWLPRMHHNFLHLYKKNSVIKYKILFHIGCQSILFFTLAMLLFSFLFKYFHFYSLFIFLVISVMLFFLIKIMIWFPGSYEKLEEFYYDR